MTCLGMSPWNNLKRLKGKLSQIEKYGKAILSIYGNWMRELFEFLAFNNDWDVY